MALQDPSYKSMCKQTNILQVIQILLAIKERQGDGAAAHPLPSKQEEEEEEEQWDTEREEAFQRFLSRFYGPLSFWAIGCYRNAIQPGQWVVAIDMFFTYIKGEMMSEKIDVQEVDFKRLRTLLQQFVDVK